MICSEMAAFSFIHMFSNNFMMGLNKIVITSLWNKLSAQDLYMIRKKGEN